MQIRVLLGSIVGMFSLFGSEYNFAPKIENPKTEKKMVVCILSYNNENYYKRNLDGLFMQDYENFKAVYIDDASTDNTWELVNDYVKEKGFEDKITLIRNEKNVGAMSNWYHLIHSLEDDDIVVTYDGDDFFAHKDVLKRVNQAYADERVWLTYGTYKVFPENNDFPIYSKAVKSADLARGNHRKLGWFSSHLRTFYAGLAKKIPVKNFQYDNGRFFISGPDYSLMLYMMDMAREHVFYIPEVLYIWNNDTPLNEYKCADQSLCPIKIVNKRPLMNKVKSWRSEH
ncbi:MAG: hypothetical protein SP4CHLAM5_11870 [Chlamydiia bacterium]|nr:hypothetical protein [Chlamydiia bacterium]MCH9619042.1 hypothetical protein [Chlamydiia bacterium]MCH9624601.1 hypothetical protein [Chlamydiia bacterium]